MMQQDELTTTYIPPSNSLKWQITKNKDKVEFRLYQNGRLAVELLNISPDEALRLSFQFKLAAELATTHLIKEQSSEPQ